MLSAMVSWLIPDPVELMARVLASSRLGPRMRVALVLLLEGCSYREACRRVGLPISRAMDLYRNAKRLGLRDLHERRREERALSRLSDRDAALCARVMGVRHGGKEPTLRQLARLSDLSFDRLMQMRIERSKRRPAPYGVHEAVANLNRFNRRA